MLETAYSTVGQLEGLSSLAAYAFEHPDYPFPSFTPPDHDNLPVFRAEDLGHPLIDPRSCVRNPLNVDAHNRFTLISGSNMSGKSTYLRAIGLNSVLARAGAPVCANSLHLSAFSLATSMRVQDSLQDGRSQFMAEIARVQKIFELSRQGPLLFLLDELLSGTNSEDRRAGAANVIARLLKLGASGLLTTHDLALAELVFSRSQIAKNVHFIDDLGNGMLAFHYRLRDGVVPHSNGAAILRVLDEDFHSLS